MTTTVSALLVSHDGERWLPAVLDGLAAQTRPVDRVVAVDTGSTDDGPRLLREHFGDDRLIAAPADSSYGAAVGTGLAALAATGPDEWVWLLHDDSAPAPDALEQLLGVAATSPSASVLGPKLREWPSLRRLLEVGVTIGGTGRRETGLEPGEYDQGQHDRPREVLAVNTAGMLVRRSVLETLGFDPRLPVLGADLDLGWRAARAGCGVLVVPDALVFHVEASRSGVRRTPVVGRHRRSDRAAALYVLLVNGSAALLPLRVVRLFLGSLLRVLALVLVRAPGDALDELGGLASTYLRPLRVVLGRRDRRRAATVPHAEVRHLLAPWWLPYRHGLDLLSDVWSALVDQVGETTAQRRARTRVVSPAAWMLLALVLGAGIAARALLGSGTLSGGALLPAPDSALDWWRTYLSSWHRIGTGSSSPAAPYLLPLAVLGTVLAGQASLVVDLMFLLAVPLAAWGGYRFLLRVTSSTTASLWGAVAYGVLPVVTGAVQGGRLGTVAGVLVLPWLAHAALFLRTGESADRRARAAWRAALWLAVLTAFVPVAWVLAAVVGLAAVAATRTGRGALGRAVVVPLLATMVLLLPWSVAVWSQRGASSLLFEAGLPVPGAADALTKWDLLTGRPGAGAPGWMSLGVPVAAVVALLRSDTRRAVLRAWVVVVVALAAAAVLASYTFSTPTSPGAQPVWVGFPLVVAQAAGITAAALAGTGIRRRLTATSFGWQQPLGGLVVALAVLTPLVCAAWWVWSGSAGPLVRGRADDIPAYITDAARAEPTNGVLVVRGSSTHGYTYTVLRQPGLRLGDDSVVPSVASQSRLTSYVADLVAAPSAADLTALSLRGVGYIYAPAPADGGLAGSLDTVSGLSPGSASAVGARAWQLDASPSATDLPAGGDPARPWLLLVQAVGLLAVVVLAAPSRKARR